MANMTDAQTPLQPLAPVPDAQNLLKPEGAAGSCCGGVCSTGQ